MSSKEQINPNWFKTKTMTSRSNVPVIELDRESKLGIIAGISSVSLITFVALLTIALSTDSLKDMNNDLLIVAFITLILRVVFASMAVDLVEDKQKKKTDSSFVTSALLFSEIVFFSIKSNKVMITSNRPESPAFKFDKMKFN